jgi:two-component sensor histidine kinase
MGNPDADSQQTADYAMALDLSSQLTLVLDEITVLRHILEIFSTLFAPRKIIFHVVDDGTVTTILTVPDNLQAPPPQPDIRMVLPELTPSGFCLRIPYKEETVGIIAVDGLAFPEHRERYLSLALAVAGVCGLAIANARTHRRLEAVLSDLKSENARSTQLSSELQMLNDNLEERVRQRTAELEKAMLQLEEEIDHRIAAEKIVRNQLAEKTLLLRELHHRVKNNLQLITSMLSTQARKVQDPSLQLALNETRNRIRTMSAVHEKLWAYQDFSHIDLGKYTRYITTSLFSLYQIRPGQVVLSIDIPEIFIDINTAIPVGLILNDLIANSIKHAFPGETKGEIFLEIREEGPMLSILFGDNGIGMPEGYDWENPDTVGFILIQSLVDQLQGTMEKMLGAGTQFRIRVQRPSGETGALKGTYNQVTE